MKQERTAKLQADGTLAQRAAIVDRMRVLPDINTMSYIGLRGIAATRLLAVCARAGHDPLLELTQRFACVTTAKAFIAFADLAGSYWPESVQVMRPCCRVVSPDEHLLAQMLETARAADRQTFENLISGMIRPQRHELLFDRAVELAALMQ